MENLKFIKENNVISIKPLTKGWSKDEKYIIEFANGLKYLIRISDKSLYDKKQKQFKLLKEIEDLDIYCSRPIEFGVLPDERVYTILSYLEGIDGEKVISKLNDKEAYNLGIQAGGILQKLHQIPINLPEKTWWDRYQVRFEKKLNGLMNCKYRIPMQEEIIKYYRDNIDLMKDRPLVFTHGDFHLGNMIVKNGKIGIIDFDRNDIADPYDDLKPFYWNTMKNEYFESGLINGYFNDELPNDFFKILKFYAAESLISHLPWAITYGKKEVETALKVASLQMKWYDSFNLEIPTWYKKSVE